jgi:hypothetical protein
MKVSSLMLIVSGQTKIAEVKKAGQMRNLLF